MEATLEEALARPGQNVGQLIEAGDVTQRIGRHMLADVFSIILNIERSRGNYIYDDKAGRYLLDCFSFIASNPLGFNHPKMNTVEFEEELLRVAKVKVSNSDLHTPAMAHFVETFARVAKPDDFTHLFFVEGGTLAVENALKTAFDWKVRLNFKNGAQEERGSRILHFREAFHGRSGYTLSLTNTDPKKTKYFPKFDWPRVINPKIIYPLEQNLAATVALEQQSIEEIQEAFRKYPDDIAAIILEPIQGEGGDNHFRREFHIALRALADQHQAMLIYDEVQTGVGLTGAMWAYQHYSVQPDIVAFGKKTQVCGIMVGPKVELVSNHVFEETSRINSTWGGNLVDMVRCRRYLEIIEEDNLVANAATVGALLLNELENLQRRESGKVSNARGKGLLCAFDVATPELRGKVVQKTLELGAIVLPCGPTSIRLRPSLTFSGENVGELVDILERAVHASE